MNHTYSISYATEAMRDQNRWGVAEIDAPDEQAAVAKFLNVVAITAQEEGVPQPTMCIGYVLNWREVPCIVCGWDNTCQYCTQEVAA